MCWNGLQEPAVFKEHAKLSRDEREQIRFGCLEVGYELRTTVDYLNKNIDVVAVQIVGGSAIREVSSLIATK